MPVDFDALVNGPVMQAFDQPVSYRPAGGATLALRGIFDRYGSAVRFDGEAEVSVTVVQLTLRLSDFPAGIAPAVGDQVTVGGVTWSVVDDTPDGFGCTLITLGNRGPGSFAP